MQERENLFFYENDIVKIAITKRNIDAKAIEVVKEAIQQYDFTVENLTYVKQIHSSDVVLVDENQSYCNKEADALITHKKQTPLMIFTADCVPLIFYDENKKNIALAHAGWRGTYHNISSQVINFLEQQLLSHRKDIKVIIGPHIKAQSYQVSKELIDKFETLNIENFYHIKHHNYYLNLEKINKDLLLAAGILEENITIMPYCTIQHNHKFFSYRKENATTKRIGTIIELK